MKSKQELQIEAVTAIINGELLLGEAMVKYNVRDKRTILAWIKKIMPLLKKSNPEADVSWDTSLKRTSEKSEPSHQDLIRENALLKKLIDLQDKVSELEKTNTQLIRHRNLLIEKVFALELRMQIQQKDTQ
ncbi:hypothetical protein [Sphingobacterium sp. SGR-19]|uniref:hypothetical protein n=1 Tax=Sphingobacterium sp. SGR-19 TaxID=2710886 RepID=UPI0013ED34A2|nr:hypothetical protein [Sphingobacterium sp. SGR-19]NGM66625.1 hypothetical protein [Sphingobacterium sp. SGR-19]